MQSESSNCFFNNLLYLSLSKLDNIRQDGVFFLVLFTTTQCLVHVPPLLSINHGIGSKKFNPSDNVAFHF